MPKKPAPRPLHQLRINRIRPDKVYRNVTLVARTFRGVIFMTEHGGLYWDGAETRVDPYLIRNRSVIQALRALGACTHESAEAALEKLDRRENKRRKQDQACQLIDAADNLGLELSDEQTKRLNAWVDMVVDDGG